MNLKGFVLLKDHESASRQGLECRFSIMSSNEASPPTNANESIPPHLRRKHPCVLCQQRKVKCDRNEPCQVCQSHVQIYRLLCPRTLFDIGRCDIALYSVLFMYHEHWDNLLPKIQPRKPY